MVPELLSYKDSLLSPLLKIIALVLFAIAVYAFYRSRRMYGGSLKAVASLLLLGGVAGFLASAFRVMGDFFTGWKWGESLFFLVLAVITLVIAYVVRKRFKDAIAMFGIAEGGEQE